MSNKSAQRAKKLSIPREMEEIQKEYQARVFSAGQLQYQIKILQDELDELNKLIVGINREGAARKELNAKAPAQNEEMENGSRN